MIEQVSPWPSGSQGAVSLTFDDGSASQLELAIPLLNELGLQGTFYLNPRDGFEGNLAPWKDAAAAGHEAGNHTVSHPCAANNVAAAVVQRRGERGARRRRTLEEMTLDEMEADIVEASRRIRSLVPEQRAISFAYPCYQSFVGRGASRQSYVPLVARHCIAGRGVGEKPIANDPGHCDLAYVWGWRCERMSGAELVGLAESAVADGRWAVLVFHGINEGHLPIGERDLTELCKYLARQRGRVWTAPVARVAEQLLAWRERAQPA
ncbi:MAG: polysaccharide deacetylase family protein [Caldilineaceae bacterium]|nr:polysaccharide deacetylase family protein [Caldilineaceae bacterium]